MTVRQRDQSQLLYRVFWDTLGIIRVLWNPNVQNFLLKTFCFHWHLGENIICCFSHKVLPYKFMEFSCIRGEEIPQDYDHLLHDIYEHIHNKQIEVLTMNSIQSKLILFIRPSVSEDTSTISTEIQQKVRKSLAPVRTPKKITD